MTIKIINYSDKNVTNLSLPLILGEVITTGDTNIKIQNLTFQTKPVIWPVVRGKFKVLVPLIKGENIVKFQHKHASLNIAFNYNPLNFKKFVRLVYIKCHDDTGNFQAPSDENNSIQSACRRIALAGQMLQTFTSDKLKEHNLKSKTFSLEESSESVICHVFTSSLSLSEAHKLNGDELWSHFAVELMNSKLRVGNDCKFLAFLSFTKYCNTLKILPSSHQGILSFTKGYVALGGGGLALFGTGCLHTWAENLQQVPWRFGDRRKIDKLKFMDDSANRGWYWACYSTGLGSTLHELGHTFDLGHTTGGIMGRGFDDIYKHFIVDMFYHHHSFHKEYNPFYKESHYSHTTPLNLTSPILSDRNLDSPIEKSPSQHQEMTGPSWDRKLDPPLENSMSQQQEINFVSKEKKNHCSGFRMFDDKKPWRIPNPPDFVSNDKSAVNVGGAYWTRSCALLLYFHKWFNDKDCSENSIAINNMELSSSNAIQVIEFRDFEGTAVHHLEFLEEPGPKLVDLTQCNLIHNLPSDVQEVSLVAEDSAGNILKHKFTTDQLLSYFNN